MRPLLVCATLWVAACSTDARLDDDDDTDVPGDAGVVDADRDGVASPRDCDDADPDNWPGNIERCDGKDNDCDGRVDDADTLDPRYATRYFLDADEDGVGDRDLGVYCLAPPRGVTLDGDCDDDDDEVAPSLPELCDGKDNDCDELIDDDDTIDPEYRRTWYVDADTDGFGDVTQSYQSCDPQGGTGVAGDCDDTDPDLRPNADEVCNGGIDDDCDGLSDEEDPSLDPGLLTTYYVDDDGDGFGTDASVFTACVATDVVTVGGDCDDTNPDVRPDALEICNGFDDDCDNRIDGTDAWWDPAWPYRIEVRVIGAPNHPTQGAPVAPEVDFGAVLTSFGDSSALDPDSVRVVYQDCAAGLPVLPSEFIDGLADPFAKGPPQADLGDGIGLVPFLFDRDGDYATADNLRSGGVGRFAIYFASVDTRPPGMQPPPASTTLVASVGSGLAELSNARTEVILTANRGGVTTSLGTVGRPSTGAQNSSPLGNGLYTLDPTLGRPVWLAAQRDRAGTLSLLHAGPVLSVVRADGQVAGNGASYAYSYVYALFEGRPEVYAKVHYVLTSDTTIGPLAPSWAAAVRPWLVNNSALSTVVPAKSSADLVTNLWARATYDPDGPDPYGIAMGYRTPVLEASRPIHDPTGSTNVGRYVGLAGQDVTASTGTATSYDGVAGEEIVAWSSLAVYPHEGTFASIEDDFLGILEGVTAEIGLADRNPLASPATP